MRNNTNSNRFDLCFHTGQDIESVDFFIHMKSELEKHGIKTIAFSLNPQMGELWKNRGMNDYIILPQYNGIPDVDWATQFAKSLGIHNYRSLYLTEKIFSDFDEKYCIQKMARLIHGVSFLKDSPKAKLYCTFPGDEFDHNTFRLLSRLHGGHTIYVTATNMAGRIAIFENEDRYWNIPKKPIMEPKDDDICQLKQYINEYTTKKTILWGDPKDRDIKWEWNYPIRFLKRSAKSFKTRNISPQWTNVKSLRSYILRAYRRYACNKYYTDRNEFRDDKTFVYFPLHYPLDSQLTLRGKPFLDQAAIVETIAQYLPYPLTLLVKEHPHARGFYKVSDIRRIAKLPNVKILHPFTNSHDLITKAKGIITINSSVGYEGILYRKPVITMGRSFYRGHGVTIDVESLYELESAFEQMENFSISEEQVINFLWKMKSNSYEAIDIFDQSSKNAEMMSEAFSGYLNKKRSS